MCETTVSYKVTKMNGLLLCLLGHTVYLTGMQVVLYKTGGCVRKVIHAKMAPHPFK